LNRRKQQRKLKEGKCQAPSKWKKRRSDLLRSLIHNKKKPKKKKKKKKKN